MANKQRTLPKGVYYGAKGTFNAQCSIAGISKWSCGHATIEAAEAAYNEMVLIRPPRKKRAVNFVKNHAEYVEYGIEKISGTYVVKIQAKAIGYVGTTKTLEAARIMRDNVLIKHKIFPRNKNGDVKGFEFMSEIIKAGKQPRKPNKPRTVPIDKPKKPPVVTWKPSDSDSAKAPAAINTHGKDGVFYENNVFNIFVGKKSKVATSSEDARKKFLKMGGV